MQDGSSSNYDSTMRGIHLRRRLVQSTLLPQKESSIKEGVQFDGSQFEVGSGNREEELEEEAEESGSKRKRRKIKRKSNSKTKTTPPDSVKKVTKNGIETPCNQIDDGDSSINFKSTFFVKTSEQRRHVKKKNYDSLEKKNELCQTFSSVGNGCSIPQKSWRQNNTTPNKEKMNSTLRKKEKQGAVLLSSSQDPFDLSPDELVVQTIPDLRLEEKLTAEENSRIFAGRQIHPFFSSWKSGKRSQDLTDPENKMLPFEREEKGIIFRPIHVFDDTEDEHSNLDWGVWKFLDRCSSDGVECGTSPIFEGSVMSLNFDKYLNVSHFTQILSYRSTDQPFKQKNKGSVILLDQPECFNLALSLPRNDNHLIYKEGQKDTDILQFNKEEIPATAVEITLLDNKPEQINISTVNSSYGNSDSEIQERINSQYYTCNNQTENCLWTDKYQPQNASQICGNGESVKFLNEWLQLWHQKGSLASRQCINEDKFIVQDDDYDCQQSDCDLDSNEFKDSLKNVLLVTGPVGSGKSAAIYACAREHGFQIIEINASDWRNGALVKQKFGEAVESHWHQRTVLNPMNSENSLSKFSSAGDSKARCSDNEVFELTPASDMEDSQNIDPSGNKKVSGENPTAIYQDETKSLILFEDVDATLYEDHGFTSTIQQLAETAKRPMILTSNSANPLLPKNLDRSELSFGVPSLKDIFILASAICAAEKIDIHPCLVERFVDYCGGDIRKTIILLQFWCNGETPGRGNKSQMTYSPVLFDLDVGLHILPKIVPWGFPSKLSEVVLEEVVKSLSLMKETLNIDDKLNVLESENIHIQDIEPDPFEAKKEAMLRLHSKLQDEAECSRFNADFQLFDSSCSPVAFTQRKSARRINAVLSDSEDDFAGGSTHPVSSGLLDVNDDVLDVKCMSPLLCLPADVCYRPTELIIRSEIKKSEENSFHHLGEADYSHKDDTCKSLDMSCIPESSFVPETELICETDIQSMAEPYGLLPNATGANLVVQDSLSNSFHLLLNDHEAFGNYSETCSSFIYQEEVGDFLSKCTADVPWVSQALDSRGCVDLISLKSSTDLKVDPVYDSVQESWNMMRNKCHDYRTHVSSEERCTCELLKFVHGTSDLISAADLLFKDCHPVLFDSLESSMDPCGSTRSYSYHDDQQGMSSILAQHGMCFYTKELASLGSISGFTTNLDLASEMLSSTGSSIALGKLVCQDRRMTDLSVIKSLKFPNPLTRKSESRLGSILESVVPSRTYLAVMGEPFHEYLSTLSVISRFESIRLSESTGQKRRRAHIARHYLSSGSIAMSSEVISLLDQYSSYHR